MKTAPIGFFQRLESLIRTVSLTMGWSFFLLVIIIVLQVILRKGFSSGLIALEELQWHLYAVGVMFGLAMVQIDDKHIRVDLFSSHFSDRTKSIIEILGILFLFLPFLVIVFLHGIDFFWESWRINERSDATTGLPYRWILKSTIPIVFGLLVLTAITRLVREFRKIFTQEIN
jgi:TRAP-type mannitol/chloroaromatic compound transport system permease small subunit